MAVFLIGWLVLPAALHATSRFGLMIGSALALGVLLIWLGAVGEKRRRMKMVATTQSLDHLSKLPWRDFERIVAEGFRKRGWKVEETGTSAGGGADGGVDLVLRRGREVVGVQCKQWRRPVGVEKVRELQGALGDFGAQRAIFVCLTKYTREARDFGARRGVELMTGEGVLEMLGHNASLAPASADAAAVPGCPRCGRPMVVRTGPTGRFYGCSQFPKCRGTRPF